MATGWWFEVVESRAPRRRVVRWLVGIEREAAALRRLLEEAAVGADQVRRVRDASLRDLERFSVGRDHLRVVE